MKGRSLGHLSFTLVFATAVIALGPRIAAADSSIQPRIVGGEVAPDGAWPWMVGLLSASESDNFQAQFCGGTLISKTWVLTAAHCVTDNNDKVYPTHTIEILAGTQKLESGQGTRVAIKRIVVHPDYFVTVNGAPNNDIALIELQNPVNLSTMRLATQEPAAGTVSTAIGWGSLLGGTTSTAFPRDLQQVDLPIVSDSVCRQIYGSILNGDIMLCAGYLDVAKDSCVGDSGGPLMVKRNGVYEQVGIVSFGPQRCAELYGVYTQVHTYGAWIKSWTGADGGSEIPDIDDAVLNWFINRPDYLLQEMLDEQQ